MLARAFLRRRKFSALRGLSLQEKKCFFICKTQYRSFVLSKRSYVEKNISLIEAASGNSFKKLTYVFVFVTNVSVSCYTFGKNISDQFCCACLLVVKPNKRARSNSPDDSKGIRPCVQMVLQSSGGNPVPASFLSNMVVSVNKCFTMLFFHQERIH